MVKNLPANAEDTRDTGLILGLGRFCRNGNLLQYSCLENSTGRGAWQAIVHGVAKSRTQLSDCVCTYGHIYTSEFYYSALEKFLKTQITKTDSKIMENPNRLTYSN